MSRSPVRTGSFVSQWCWLVVSSTPARVFCSRTFDITRVKRQSLSSQRNAVRSTCKAVCLQLLRASSLLLNLKRRRRIVCSAAFRREVEERASWKPILLAVAIECSITARFLCCSPTERLRKVAKFQNFSSLSFVSNVTLDANYKLIHLLIRLFEN